MWDIITYYAKTSMVVEVTESKITYILFMWMYLLIHVHALCWKLVNLISFGKREVKSIAVGIDRIAFHLLFT